MWIEFLTSFLAAVFTLKCSILDAQIRHVRLEVHRLNEVKLHIGIGSNLRLLNIYNLARSRLYMLDNMTRFGHYYP